MNTPYLIVGLGNPGRGYEDTRHNAGFEVVSLLAERRGLKFAAGKGDYVVARGQFGDIPVILAKPTTFMNQSGFAVQGLTSFFKIEVEQLLVIVDDVNIPLGRIRFRSGGSGGGQKGLENIIYQLGRDDFTRLRVGAGKFPQGRDSDNRGDDRDFSRCRRSISERGHRRSHESIQLIGRTHLWELKGH